MRRIIPLLLAAVLAGGACSVFADQPQSLSASVDGKSFVSDDDSILLIPVMGTFTLKASTAGASSWPPPKTPVDRLSISCDARSLAQPMKLVATDFAPNVCQVSFEQGPPAGSDQHSVTYELDKSAANTLFEITAVRGKVIEGRFSFTLKNAGGKTIVISDGRFVAEDRQI